MFVVSIVIAIIIGYILKGKLRNISEFKYRGIWFIAAGFLLETCMKMLLAKGVLEIGTSTFVINVIMYTLIMVFIFLNIKDKFILTIGIGFVLNIIVIFANSCTMPVGIKAAELLNFSGEISKLGLYSMVNSDTLFVFLADVIPYKIGPLNGIASVGDIFICIGIMGIIIREMKKKPYKEYKEINISNY